MKTDSFKWEKQGDKLTLTIEFDAIELDSDTLINEVGSMRGNDFLNNLNKVCSRLKEVYQILINNGFSMIGDTLDLSPNNVPTLTINVLL